MSRKVKVAVIVVVVGGVATAGYFAFRKANEARLRAEQTADEIEQQLRDLDPLTRAAVLARLGARARHAIPTPPLKRRT